MAHHDQVAHQDLAELQDQVAHLAQREVDLARQAASRDSARMLPGQDLRVVQVVAPAQPEPSVRVALGVSQESPSALSARNLNKEKHRA